jgi:hypothetical protein
MHLRHGNCSTWPERRRDHRAALSAMERLRGRKAGGSPPRRAVAKSAGTGCACSARSRASRNGSPAGRTKQSPSDRRSGPARMSSSFGCRRCMTAKSMGWLQTCCRSPRKPGFRHIWATEPTAGAGRMCWMSRGSDGWPSRAVRPAHAGTRWQKGRSRSSGSQRQLPTGQAVAQDRPTRLRRIPILDRSSTWWSDSTLTRGQLGWVPTGPSLFSDLTPLMMRSDDACATAHPGATSRFLCFAEHKCPDPHEVPDRGKAIGRASVPGDDKQSSASSGSGTRQEAPTAAPERLFRSVMRFIRTCSRALTAGKFARYQAAKVSSTCRLRMKITVKPDVTILSPPKCISQVGNAGPHPVRNASLRIERWRLAPQLKTVF